MSYEDPGGTSTEVSNRCSGGMFTSSSSLDHPRALFLRRPLAVDEADAEARRVLGETLVERFPLERVHQFGVAARDQAELRLRHEVPDDSQKFVAAPSHADVALRDACGTGGPSC